METVKLRHEALCKALLSLHIGLRRFDQAQHEHDFEGYLLMRDGFIQRFEYCIDSFWKFIKLHLEMVEKIPIESTRPREILRLALDNIITQEEHDALIEAIAERNLTSHSYNDSLATKIQKHIPAYLEVMQAIADRLKVE